LFVGPDGGKPGACPHGQGERGGGPTTRAVLLTRYPQGYPQGREEGGISPPRPRFVRSTGRRRRRRRPAPSRRAARAARPLRRRLAPVERSRVSRGGGRRAPEP